MRKLLLGKSIQGIGLILFGCFGIADCKPSVFKLFHSCIMPCRDIISPDIQAPFKQCLPFHEAIACNTRIWRPCMKIFIRKIVHYLFFEHVLEIHHIIRYPYDLSNPSGILYRTQTAASALCLKPELILILPYLHRDSDNIVSCFFQKKCRDGRINSARHSYYNLFWH